MKLGSLDLDRQRLLIAEIGNNHEGDPVLALELAEAAVEAGADAVKAQIIDPPRLINIAQSERIAQLTRFRLKPDVFMEMAQRVRKRGGMFMASVFDCDTLAAVQGNMDAIKIASGDLDFDPMLELAARSDKSVVLSTGMATLPEIRRAVTVFGKTLGSAALLPQRLALLHCVSLYPTPAAQANLRAVPHLAKTFGLTTGYSDHTLGLEAATTALALGARIIEKHFTLNKTRSDFRDHALSAEPAELCRLADIVHGMDAMLGSGERDTLPDNATRQAARRSIVAVRALKAGHVLQASDLDYIRPANGLPPHQVATLVGRKLRADIERQHVFQLQDVD